MKGRIHVLDRRQRLPIPPHEAFEFFCDVRNLEPITPPWLHFVILTPTETEVGPGALIDYRLRLHGLPVRWRTEITAWEPARRFVDRQIRGPYALWEHTHSFELSGEGTLMGDRVRYALPFGALGDLAHRAFVRRDLDRIFDFRARKIAELLDPQTARSPASA